TNQGFLTEPDQRSGAPQEELIHHLPFLDQTSTPKEKGDTSFGADLRPVLLVDVDKGLLNDTNRENLEDMGLDLPSVVQKRGTFKETLEKVESENKSIGQFLGIKSKKTESERLVYESYKETLKIYKRVIKALQETQQFITSKDASKKTGTGLCRR